MCSVSVAVCGVSVAVCGVCVVCLFLCVVSLLLCVSNIIWPCKSGERGLLFDAGCAGFSSRRLLFVAEHGL